MKFTKLVPNIFYSKINDGLEFFVECLGFEITYRELHGSKPFCLLERDGLQIYLFEDDALAKEHNPELRLVTNDIEDVYQKVSQSHPAFLHPNLSKITLRPWGAKEFALADIQLGVIVQQWPNRSESEG